MKKSLDAYKVARERYFMDIQNKERKRKESEMSEANAKLYNLFQQMREEGRFRLYSTLIQGNIAFLSLTIPLMSMRQVDSVWQMTAYCISVTSAIMGVICGVRLLKRPIRISNRGLKWLQEKEEVGDPFDGGEVSSEDTMAERIAMKVIVWTLPIAAFVYLIGIVF